MIFHISSRVASRSTSALLSPVPLTGCPAADTWSQTNQRSSSQAHPYPTEGFPTPQHGREGPSKLQEIPQKDTLLSGNTTLLLGQKVCPMRRVGSCSSCCKWGLFYPNPSTKEGPQKDEGKDHISNHRDSLQLGWNHMCRLPSSKQINTNLLSALPQAGSHGQEDWARLNPAT